MLIKRFSTWIRSSKTIYSEYGALIISPIASLTDIYQSLQPKMRIDNKVSNAPSLSPRNLVLSRSFSESQNFTAEKPDLTNNLVLRRGKEAAVTREQKARKNKTSSKDNLVSAMSKGPDHAQSATGATNEEQKQVLKKRKAKKVTQNENFKSSLTQDKELMDSQSLIAAAKTKKINENVGINSVVARAADNSKATTFNEESKGSKISAARRSKSKDNNENKTPEERLQRPITNNFDLGDGRIPVNRIKISSWNINGLRAVISRGQLQSYFKSHNFDIICFNETKIDETKLNNNKLIDEFPSEYYLYFNCSKSRLGYSGTGIASKYKPLSVSLDLGISKHDQEGRAVTLEFEHFYLISCYVPNAGEGLSRLDYRTSEWDVELRRFVTELKKKKHVILCGDLNVAHQEIDIHDPVNNRNVSAGFTDREREGMTNLLNEGFVDTFREFYPRQVKYSWWSMRNRARIVNKGWRIDYFLIDRDGMKSVVDSIINNDIYGSDHCPVELIFDPNFS